MQRVEGSCCAVWQRPLITGVALLGSPAALLLAELLHPRARGGVAGQLEAASTHSGRWLAADLAVLAALVLAPFLIIALLRLAGGVGSRLALAGATLALAGIPLTAGRVTVALVLWSLADRRFDPAVLSIARDLQDGWPFVLAYTSSR
jgi:hypothetical protein